MRHLFLTWLGLVFSLLTVGQNYHAINGSMYAGSLGVGNNPSAIVNTPYKWDLTLFGTQVKSSTNAVTLYNFSLIHFRDTIEYLFNNGYKNRYLVLNDNLNILNTRIAINKKSSIAFGINIKNYVFAKTNDYNFIDTVKSPFDFFAINQQNTNLTLDVAHSAWIELFGTYARTVIDNETSRLNAGITLKVTRGISGAYGRLNNGQFSSATQNNEPDYAITQGSLQYGYSSNYDKIKDENSTAQNRNTFLKNSRGSFSFDAGFEYMVKPLQVTDIYDEDDYYDYDWKIGVSVLDIGFNSFNYGKESRAVSGIKAGITSTVLESKFDSSITSVAAFNDSLASIVNQSAVLRGKFNVLNPMRLVINVDRFIYKDFYINAELSIATPSSFVQKYSYVKDLDLLTITPRWETRNFGAYLPITYNNQKQLWVGSAFKIGPVLFGIHNWGNLLSKHKMQNGGGYIAFIIHAGSNSENRKIDKRWNCPN